MPPRYAYWTILIDKKATAFRAREREELLPTFHQLKRKNADIVMKWYARGRLWESPAEAEAALRSPSRPAEKRGAGWRPGGEHRDPRDRFTKQPARRQARSAKPSPWHDRPQPTNRPGWRAKPNAAPRKSVRVTHGRRAGGKAPWQRDRSGRTGQGKPWNAPRHENEERPKRHDSFSSATSAAPEQVVGKPKPPDRG
jgi:hypothetical protein